MASISWKTAVFVSLLSSVQAQSNTTSSYYTSPTVYPSPNATGNGGWDAAYSRAQEFLSQLNVSEKAYMVTGVSGPCTGNIAPIPRLGFNGICLQDGPTAIRPADYASVFPAGITTASSWDKTFFFQRGAALGQEFRDKGTHVILG
jgi:beta-glucosidase